MNDAAAPPARLALQTGRLDDRRAAITPEHRLWASACDLLADQEAADGVEAAAAHDERMVGLCVEWPVEAGQEDEVEALAVTVALALPFAGEERILAALATSTAGAAELRRRLSGGPVLATPHDAPRPRFPHIYDPDSAATPPIVALLDGPRSRRVAELLELIKERDRNLADAVVLGADVDMLDSLERLGAAARSAGRTGLADMFEHDRQLWRARADAARGRQRLEGSHYHWVTDNIPPEGLEAARHEIQHNVEVLLHLPPRDG